MKKYLGAAVALGPGVNERRLPTPPFVFHYVPDLSKAALCGARPSSGGMWRAIGSTMISKTTCCDICLSIGLREAVRTMHRVS